MNLRSSLRTLAFASVCALPLPAGVVTINFTQTGGNVVVTLSGSLTDSTAWQFNGNTATSSSILPGPSGGFISFGGIGGSVGDEYLARVPILGTWTGGFGTAIFSSAAISTGGIFGFSGAAVIVPTGYAFSSVSPTNLNSTMTFTGTFASLGITPTATSAIYGGDTIRLTFGGSSVPDAGPGPALALLLGGLGLRQWHSSRRSRAAA
jgi:hypothetical protein